MADKLIKKYLDGQIVSLTNNLEELAKIKLIKGENGKDAINNISIIKIIFINDIHFINLIQLLNDDIPNFTYENILNINVKYNDTKFLNKQGYDTKTSFYLNNIEILSFVGPLIRFNRGNDNFKIFPENYSIFITYANKIDKEITV